MTTGSRLTMKRIFAAALCAAVLGAAAPASAADLGALPADASTSGFRMSIGIGATCAYAGYYCLYAEYAYVYHYPFDDRPIAYAHYRHRTR